MIPDPSRERDSAAASRPVAPSGVGILNHPVQGGVMRSKGRVARLVLPVLLLAVASWMAPAEAARKTPAPAASAPAPRLRDVGQAFEAAQLLSGAARLTALDNLDRTLPKIVEGAGPAERSAALALAAATRYARADFAGAEDAYRKALK